MSGTQDLVIAAGVESMSRVAMGSNFALQAQADLGTGPFSARIRERFGVNFSQFRGAQMIADRYDFTRDEYTLGGHRRYRGGPVRGGDRAGWPGATVRTRATRASATTRHWPALVPSRHAYRGHRSLRGQRGLRARAPCRLRDSEADPERPNVNGGRSRSGIRSERAAPSSRQRSCMQSGHVARAFGLQTTCEGGGIANVTIVERL